MAVWKIDIKKMQKYLKHSLMRKDYILNLLQNGEKCACELIDDMNIRQSALSYHMKILCESGIVQSRQDGKWTHYSLSKAGSAYAIQRLSEITTPHTEQVKNCCK